MQQRGPDAHVNADQQEQHCKDAAEQIENAVRYLSHSDEPPSRLTRVASAQSY